MPGGSVPAERLQVMGVSPVAVNVAEKDVPTTPSESELGPVMKVLVECS